MFNHQIGQPIVSRGRIPCGQPEPHFSKPHVISAELRLRIFIFQRAVESIDVLKELNGHLGLVNR